MDIVNRIKLFLNLNGIANSQFADVCDIPRPTVSQLLNGRNKKVSDEVITKIHQAYPSLSIMWLMFGEEPMMDSNIPNANTQEGCETKASENSINQNVYNADPENQNLRNVVERENLVKNGTEASNEGKIEGADNEINPISQALESIAKNVGKCNVGTVAQGNAKKRVVNVMVFYSDNSFESFVPTR